MDTIQRRIETYVEDQILLNTNHRVYSQIEDEVRRRILSTSSDITYSRISREVRNQIRNNAEDATHFEIARAARLDVFIECNNHGSALPQSCNRQWASNDVEQTAQMCINMGTNQQIFCS